MDPAFLNYLQSLQGGQMNNPQAQMQQQGQISGMQPQQGVAQPVNNPFNIGISNAIESARQSLGMTQKQQDKALRSSMLTFANNMSQQPRERGFFNNFASVGRALSPAIATHDAEEEAALIANNKLANQILAYQQAEQERQAQEEQRHWQRQHAERQLEGTEDERAWHRQHYGAQLEEQKRAHNLMYNLRTEKEANKFGANADQNGLVGGKYPAFASKTERADYARTYKSSSNVISETNDILRKYDAFEAKYPNSYALLPYIGQSVSKTKGLLSAFSKDKGLKDEVKAIAQINHIKGSVISDYETAKRKGVLTAGLVKIFEERNVVPKKGDSLLEIKSKMEQMNEIAKELALSSKYSLQYNAHITPMDLPDFVGKNNQAQEAPQVQEAPQQKEFIWIRGPTGEEGEVHYKDAEALLQQPGYSRVGQ